MRIFLICPVRYAGEAHSRKIAEYVRQQENVEGNTVHWPARDTLQTGDPIGTRIIGDNFFAMSISQEVHVWYDITSQGSLFDLGMAWAMGKLIRLANRNEIPQTTEKSFSNFLLDIDGKRNPYLEGTTITRSLLPSEWFFKNANPSSPQDWEGYFEHEEGHRMRVPESLNWGQAFKEAVEVDERTKQLAEALAIPPEIFLDSKSGSKAAAESMLSSHWGTQRPGVPKSLDFDCSTDDLISEL
jgi:hypothetical protein